MRNKEIEELKNSIVKELSPLSIYLFGSFAKGSQNEDSDFDFYIIVDDNKEKEVLPLTAKAYKSIRFKQKRPVDIIVNTRSHFDRRKSLPTIEKEVVDTGVLLYGRWS